MATKRVTVSKSKGKGEEAQMFITTSGQLFSSADLKRYEIPQTKQIIEPVWNVGESIEPPYDLTRLMAWIELSVPHASCIRTKVQDGVGIGWHLNKVDNLDPEVSNELYDKEYDILANFFEKCNEGEDIISVAKKSFLDYEGCGNGYIEVVRGLPVEHLDRSIKSLYHVTATTVRWAGTKDKFLQKVSNKKVYFKVYGDQDPMDKNTGARVVVKPEDLANELLQFKQYTPRSYWYGLPEWLPAVFPMYGEMKEKEYNLDFFTNYGVPAYAVVLKGIKVSKEVEEGIKKYFETEVKGNPHRTMVFGMPEGGEVVFEKLSVEQKEASFRIYKRDNRDDILTAHRVPPYRAAIVERGQLGGSVASDTDRIYLDSVINPRQRDFEWVINQLMIKEGFGIRTWEFAFDDINIDDRKMQSEIDTAYFNMGALTPNQIRVKMGLEPYEGGDSYYVMGGMIPVGSEPPENLTVEAGKKTPITDSGDYVGDLAVKYESEGVPIDNLATFFENLEKVGKYVRARVKQPGDFQEGTFRTIELSAKDGIKAVVGKLSGETAMTIQAYLFDAERWDVARVRKWLSARKIKAIDIVGD